jgi:hypothetical protein
LGRAVEVGPLVEALSEEGAGFLLWGELERAHAMEHVHVQLLDTLAEALELCSFRGRGSFID